MVAAPRPEPALDGQIVVAVVPGAALRGMGKPIMNDDDSIPLIARILTLALALVLVWPAPVEAGGGIISLYWYGSSSDGHLGRETAFASWWVPPNIPLLVRDDWPGVALHGYAPGTKVRITVIGLPAWANSWPGLGDEVIGRSVAAYVADRPGGEYGDAWPATFAALTDGRCWIGKLQVRIEVE